MRLIAGGFIACVRTGFGAAFRPALGVWQRVVGPGIGPPAVSLGHLLRVTVRDEGGVTFVFCLYHEVLDLLDVKFLRSCVQ